MSSPKRDERNVENIRRKNLEDNQLFLQRLLMINIRNDFLNSARTVLRKDGSSQIKKKVSSQKAIGEYVTRYRDKLKSGEIGPYVPEWQRHNEAKKKEAEKKLLEKERKKLEYEQKKIENERKRQEKQIKKQEILFERELKKVEKILKIEEKQKIRLAKRRRHKSSRWTVFYKNSVNGNPYQRIFKPRHTKVDERIQQNLF
ncbi:unnamed protein product [Rotaria sp. Silwood1]|nr:unnamed protein product [Rotaria sp. Silwood1]CAF0939746.1 unnamed protein product [Rotaria sp. Silwood1]CAF3373818.1 unnamed protein product [Rotaria sp. Silwood1]CAF3381949.1 unnamed protein product [Rotaria sp. Silwood1]CAF3393717.1 unnamed protein product [Rotaria sp. Silwood1]